MRRSIATLVACGLIFAFLPAPPASALPHHKRKMGLQLHIGLGVDGCTDNWCEDHDGWTEIDPSAGLRMQALFRFLKYGAVGLHLGIMFGDPDHSEPDRAWSLILGLEARGIYPYKWFDFWGSLVLGYSRTQTEGTGHIYIGGFDIQGDYRGWYDGFALGFGAGVDFFISKWFGVGLEFFIYNPWYDEGCTKWNDQATRCWELTDEDRNDIGVIWSVGFHATFFIGL